MREAWVRGGLARNALAVLAVVLVAADPPGPVPADDETFRPTVLIRRGSSQGSGTVIASVAGETLVLTAAHVVRNPGDLIVELHRYNLGLEDRAAPGVWPLRARAEIVARDRDADVAVVRIRGLQALPYVARLAVAEVPPGPGAVVTAVGITRGTRLSSWTAQVQGAIILTREQGGSARMFLVTSRAPDPGRSGGGLYRADGKLVGVCLGRIQPRGGTASGLFAEGDSIGRLLARARLVAPMTPTASGAPAKRPQP